MQHAQILLFIFLQNLNNIAKSATRSNWLH